MRLSLKGTQLVPNPLRERDLTRSQIWDTEWEMEPGSFNLIHAPSGTGKTTFANLLFGLRHDYTGTFYWQDEPAVEMNIRDWCALRKDHVAMVFQDLRLFQKYTAWENIILKNQLTNHVSEEILRSWATRLGIDSLLDKPAHQISQGEKQRVAIIRGLAQPIDWIIMDEPFSNLDQENSRKAAQLIEEVAITEGAGIICLQLDPDHHFEYTKTFQL